MSHGATLLKDIYPWLTELFYILGQLPEIPCRLIPQEALIREFTGNGKYSD